MPDLLIKNVPAELVGKLRERAKANHRSLQGELLALVSQAASEPSAAVDEGPARQIRQGHKSIEQIAAEHRARVAQPLHKGGRSVDLIRKERDASWANQPEIARQALIDLAELRLTRCAVNPAAQFDLAQRLNLTAYDAAYLQLALDLGAPLATFDRRLGLAAGKALV